MERIIRPYSAHGTAPAIPSHPGMIAGHMPVVHAIPAKTPADMVRAVKRRWPVVLVMTALFGCLGAAYVMRMPAVFKAVAQVQIDPPKFDPNQAVIVANNQIPVADRESSEKFVPNRLVWLTGRRLAETVLAEGEFGDGRGFEGDGANEILANLSTRRIQPGTNVFAVELEGADPQRVAKLLNALLDYFNKDVQSKSVAELRKATEVGAEKLRALKKELEALDGKIELAAKETPIFGPKGSNLLVDDHTAAKSMLMSKKIQIDNLRHEERMTSMYPSLKGMAPPSRYQRAIEALIEKKELYQTHLDNAARLTRHFDTDPASKHWAKLLDKALDELEELQALDAKSSFDLPDRSALTIAHGTEEIRKLEREVKDLFAQVQETMPKYQKFQSLIREREQKEARIGAMQERLASFEMVMDSRSSPVEILLRASEPGGPVRPNRPMLIAMISMLGGLFGVGLVCVREYLDHSIKVPEHLTVGLTLPVLCVIPRMKRLARLSRGGTCGRPTTPTRSRPTPIATSAPA